MLGALVGSIAMANLEDDPRRACKDAAEEQAAAAQQYVANPKALVAARVVPGLQRGILKTATSRPGALTVEVTDDPSPYRVTARVDADGSWTVRLSPGYTTLHDAALDAAGLAAALHRPQALRRYLAYQQDLARQNAVHRALGEATERARSFAEFIGLSSRTAETVFARREWKRERDRAQTESLGWVVAYLLTREDPRLPGMSSSAGRDGEAAARLAAASGWRPVPPFAVGR